MKKYPVKKVASLLVGLFLLLQLRITYGCLVTKSSKKATITYLPVFVMMLVLLVTLTFLSLRLRMFGLLAFGVFVFALLLFIIIRQIVHWMDCFGLRYMPFCLDAISTSLYRKVRSVNR